MRMDDICQRLTGHAKGCKRIHGEPQMDWQTWGIVMMMERKKEETGVSVTGVFRQGGLE